MRERRTLADLLPMVRETTEGIVVAVAWEDMSRRLSSDVRQELDNGQAYRTDRCPLPAVDQP